MCTKNMTQDTDGPFATASDFPLQIRTIIYLPSIEVFKAYDSKSSGLSI
jgi:hypothetical protein